MTRLTSLPYEVLSNIVDNIEFDDVFNLGLTCKALNIVITEESLCKSIVQSKIPHSQEAKKAKLAQGGFATALRAAAKRRNAFATLSPFTLATIGFCDAYLYDKGGLCYTLDDMVRILDLHNSHDQEIVFNFPALVNRTLPIVHDNIAGNFRVLSYSDQIISCVYERSDLDKPAWLIAFSVRNGALLMVRYLVSTEMLFVRHNSEFLYYGTHSEIDIDGHKKWTIYGYKFRERDWFEKIHLSGMVGSDINSTVCFEFHDRYFYALSSQTSLELEEIDWTSYYHVTRFPLDSPNKDLIEETLDEDMWRRQHEEGPIDDRWTSLQLDVDETSGELKIVEARREWDFGSLRYRRSYYTTNIKFPQPGKKVDDIQDTGMNSQLGGDDSTPSSITSAGSGSPSMSPATSHLPSGLLNSQIGRLIGNHNNPHYLEPPPRTPQSTHMDTAQLTSTIASTPIRMYHFASSSFLDLVDDRLPTGSQQLRLRGGSRRLMPPPRDSDGLLCPYSKDLGTSIKDTYKDSDINYWPPLQNPDDSKITQLYRLLNPPSHLGGVEGTADDRSLVYTTGPMDKPKALIFIGFDAGIKLRGLRRWENVEEKKQGIRERTNINSEQKGRCVGDYIDGEEQNRTDSLERKGKGPEVRYDSTSSNVSSVIQQPADDTASTIMQPPVAEDSWLWLEGAMYLDINRGVNIGPARQLSN